jgi:hypothetical protein
MASRIYSYADKVGTVSNVLRSHRAEIRSIEKLDEAKSFTIEILTSEAKINGTTAIKYINWIKNNIHNINHLYNYVDAVIRRGEEYPTDTLRYQSWK